MAEHAELVRRDPAARVDVIDVGGDAVGGQRVEVVAAGSAGPARVGEAPE